MSLEIIIVKFSYKIIDEIQMNNLLNNFSRRTSKEIYKHTTSQT